MQIVYGNFEEFHLDWCIVWVDNIVTWWFETILKHFLFLPPRSIGNDEFDDHMFIHGEQPPTYLPLKYW